jgi:hypothetical protein
MKPKVIKEKDRPVKKMPGKNASAKVAAKKRKK